MLTRPEYNDKNACLALGLVSSMANRNAGSDGSLMNWYKRVPESPIILC